MKRLRMIRASLKWFLSLPKIVFIIFFDPVRASSKRYYKILGAKRFIVLTPQLSLVQVIYDRARKKFIKIYTRDYADLVIIKQIFINHDYGLYKLSRYQELNEFYKKIILGKKIPLIIDCGANSGMAVRYFKETYDDAHVVGDRKSVV